MTLNLGEGEYFGNQLKSWDSAFFKLSVTSYAPNSKTDKHDHENDYLSILLKGVYAEKNNNETKIILPGNILFRPAAYPHQNVFANEHGSCFNIEFKSSWTKQLDLSLQIPKKFCIYKTGTFPSLYNLMLTFNGKCNDDLVMEFITEWLLATNATINGKNFGQPIADVLKIVEAELEKFHSIQSLADRLLVHPVYLARAFKKKTGITIGQYQLQAKLERAMSMLLNANLSISDISYALGFYDDAHFIHSFKARYGMSPHKSRLIMKG